MYSFMDAHQSMHFYAILMNWDQDKNDYHFCRQFQVNFLQWKLCISIQILLKFAPKGLINNKPALI